MSTCGSCIESVSGKRKDARSPVKTGIVSKDGLILRDQGGKCVYCSVLHGKCSKDSDCCAPPYTGYTGQVFTTTTFESTLHKFEVDKVKCAGGKCEFDSCVELKGCVIGSGKRCCNSKARCSDLIGECLTTTKPPLTALTNVT